MPLQIVIPMAGRGARFNASGFEIPKPFLKVAAGKLMIDLVIQYLTPKQPHRFIFVCRKDHATAFGLNDFFARRVKHFKIVTTDRVTRGPACTALLAGRHINDRHPLLIAYCDDYLDIFLDDFLDAWKAREADGGMLIYPSTDPANSYAVCGRQGLVSKTAEKKRLSRWATAGLYFFRQGGFFVQAARKMVRKEASVKEEYFVCPVYNEMIANGHKVIAFKIPGRANQPMGTPRALARFIRAYRPS